MLASIRFLPTDFRFGARALLKTPLFTAGAIVTLALAISANAAIFSVVHGVLVRQLPFADADRVFWIWSDYPGRDRMPFNVPDFIDYRDRNRSLAGFAGFFAFNANLSDETEAERVQGVRATTDLFTILKARPALGRMLEPEDARPGREHVAVIAHSLFQRRFGGDASIIGRPIRLNSETYAVVGVTAPDFVLPVRDVEFVIPFIADLDSRREARNSLNFINGVGRLRDGLSREQAADDLTAIARRLKAQFPVENARKFGVRMVPALTGIVGSFQTALLSLFGAVVAVLLIACANLANLMLTRASGRRKDIAVRLALGSTRARVVQQSLAEAVLLGVAGGGLGILLAQWGVHVLLGLAPSDLPRADAIRVDGVVLAFSAGVSLLTGIVFGVVPAFTAAAVDVNAALQGSSRAVAAGHHLVRGVLVASEVALAFVLLVVLGLIGKSFANVQAVEPGFDAAHALTARLALPARRYHNREAIVGFQRTLRQRLAAIPAVTEAGAVSLLPLSGLSSRVPFTVEGQAIERERIPAAQFRFVSPGYFEAARIPLVRGRTFSEADAEASRPVAVVNQALAAEWLAGRDPIGARLLIDDNDGSPRPVDIIGVVGNVRQITLDAEPTIDLYLPYPQLHADTIGGAAANMFWVVRSDADPGTLGAQLTREIRAVDPEVAAAQIRPFDRYLTASVAPRRFSLLLLEIFGGAALLLAVTGIYAVISYNVSQRAREIGIRVALGARRADIVRLVLRHGAGATAAGLLLGIAMAAAATRALSSMLFGLTPTDLPTFLQVAAVVTAVAVLACVAPAVRATRTGAVLPQHDN
jgi:predicted permease